MIKEHLGTTTEAWCVVMVPPPLTLGPKNLMSETRRCANSWAIHVPIWVCVPPLTSVPTRRRPGMRHAVSFSHEKETESLLGVMEDVGISLQFRRFPPPNAQVLWEWDRGFPTKNE